MDLMTARYDQTIVDLIGQHGGADATYWEIIGIEGEGMTLHFPSIAPDGREIPYSIDNEQEYWRHKTRQQRYTVRLLVTGNPVSCEAQLKQRGWKCMSTSPNTVDLYVDPALVQDADTSEA